VIRAVAATWEEGLRCRVAAGEHEIVVDEPASVGGTGQGPQPTELFLASLASCFTLAVSYSATKRGVTLEALHVEAVGTYDGPRFAALEVRVRGALADDPEGDRFRRVVAAAERVCYVSNTLRAAPVPDVVVV
jgi:organic hydroperoxide reductase OsmC/OhrA